VLYHITMAVHYVDRVHDEGGPHAVFVRHEDLRDASSPREELELAIDRDHLSKVTIALGENEHHCVELVHLAEYAFTISIARRRIVEPRGMAAAADRVLGTSHRIGVPLRYVAADRRVLVHAHHAYPIGYCELAALLQFLD
jgi:hypothetical protein